MAFNNIYSRRLASLQANRMEMQEAKVDFRAVIGDILNHGITQTDLAVMTGVSTTMITRYKHSVTPAEPNYQIGARLIDIHRKITSCGTDRYRIDKTVRDLRGF